MAQAPEGDFVRGRELAIQGEFATKGKPSMQGGLAPRMELAVHGELAMGKELLMQGEFVTRDELSMHGGLVTMVELATRMELQRVGAPRSVADGAPGMPHRALRRTPESGIGIICRLGEGPEGKDSFGHRLLLLTGCPFC